MGAYFRRSRRMGTKTWLMVTILGFASISNASLPTPELSGSIRSITRNPRLFYVSTTTSTSFATTRCYIGSAAGTCPNTGRKRRNLVSDELESQLVDEEEEEISERDAKMMLYWVTTTTTTTSYTATSTLATLGCVPDGWQMVACGN